MHTTKDIKKMIISHFDDNDKLFYLRSKDGDQDLFTLTCNIKMQGTVNHTLRSVNKDLPTETYSVYRFTNPYLNAENDLFKINYAGKSIGLIIPNSALEDNVEKYDEDFDEYIQAYKFYCSKHIIEHFDFSKLPENETLNLSDLLDLNSIYAIICNSLIKEDDFTIENCLPSLAIKGYYLFPENIIPNVLSFVDVQNDDLDSLIQAKYLKTRDEKSIHINKSSSVIEHIPLLKLLYRKLLVENSNPLFRFLVLYQVIEFLLEEKVREGIDAICDMKEGLNNFDFFQKMYEVNNTRSIINSLFDKVNFDDKNEITNALKDFILQTSPEYSKQATGDCLYDIRNLLFHDFKRIIEVDKGAVIGLIMQCEILIHHLINSIQISKPEIIV
ncbi:hypothetical protein FFWV33_03920 [Flavobacterium faecale]|uniref:Uncharacterized protein n=1 Tax=Flavobacterium faecale TaxID=1355330 RepID=A0A2S1LAI9_9FLAO|nr:hypothetical protein [Flavobacterium faecale]AWG20747.1 hypothetical protein FFWV33_03920 [Flavobacterium faecale]